MMMVCEYDDGRVCVGGLVLVGGKREGTVHSQVVWQAVIHIKDHTDNLIQVQRVRMFVCMVCMGNQFPID